MSVKLVADNQEFELPVLDSTLGRPVLDISAIAKAGYWSYDPGFMAAALWIRRLPTLTVTKASFAPWL